MKKTVLVVDDDEDLIEIIQTHLEEKGFAVIGALGGREGLARAIEEKPDLIILDIAMPEMDGFEMLEELRRMPPLEKTPVMMLTAQGKSQNIFEATRLHAVDFLIKPFTREELIRAVDKVI